MELVEQCAGILGVEATPEVRQALERLLSDDAALWQLLDALSSHREPDTNSFADLDERVESRMRERWGDRVDNDRLLRKRKKLDEQGRRLLAVLASRVGKEVSLRDLMLYNRFSAATDRRLRELKTEHGAFDIETIGSGRESRYLLVSTEPDIDRCAEYWLLNNIRESDLSVPARLLSLLKARMPEKVTISEFRYVNPGQAAGKGLPRMSQSSTDRRVRELREDGWRVYSHYDNAVAGLGPGEYVMLTLDRIPAYERLKPEQWRRVMEGKDYRCARCGWGRKDGPSQGRKLVEVHHKDPQHARPEDVNYLSNLEPLCNRCHDAE